MPGNCPKCGSPIVEAEPVCANCGERLWSDTRPEPVAVFYSYSHEDEDLRRKLEAHLAALRRSGLIREWHDRKIIAGQDWNKEISRYLESAELILFLISADFISSSYIFDVEVKRALEKHSAGQAAVVPVILRPVTWKIIPELSQLQALPEGARPVTEWPSHDLAFVSVCEGIIAAILARAAIVPRKPLVESSLRSFFRFPRPRRPASRRRILDAALPARVPLTKPSTLLVMIHRTDSPGLRAIVEADPEYDISVKDIDSRQVTLKFPVDENGTPNPLDLDIRVESPQFEPSSQIKSIKIPPRGDSLPRVFFLTPTQVGSLLVNLEIYRGDEMIAGCVLRTLGVEAASGPKEFLTPQSVASTSLGTSSEEEAAPREFAKSTLKKTGGLERCSSGHLYDPAKHTTCPYCGVSDLDFFKTNPRRTVPVPRVDEPEAMRTRPKGERPPGGTDPGATQPFFRKKLGLDPVVGWLVCVEGNDRGRDYRIRGENNFIGRSESMDICIAGDDGISRENHAVITFDPKTSSFKLFPGEAHGMVYLNGEAVYSPVDINAHDQIQLGRTQLRFIPFCGDRFQWM